MFTNFEKETVSFNVNFESIDEDIKVKDIKILQYEKEIKSLNVSLSSKEHEIKTKQCSTESLNGEL